jgi:tRNA-dihydrouridine synthase C
MNAAGPDRIILAPMEGLADAVLRDLLTRVGVYNWCVSEFARVSSTVLPRRFFRRVCPELDRGARTAAGTPVRVQLLGADPDLMAASAAKAAELDPFGIDLNFGCPAPLVNRHGGGASLLDDPESLRAITAAVRRAVPAGMPVTGKMRLGIRDASRALDCARALADGGASEIVVHARTKEDGYRPPARWEWIARIREAVDVRVIANGEIWTPDDWRRCRSESGCSDVMIGRGAVADPLLSRRLRGELAECDDAACWQMLLPAIAEFWQRELRRLGPRFAPGRLKQWLALLARRYAEGAQLAALIRPLQHEAAINAVLAPFAEAAAEAA